MPMLRAEIQKRYRERKKLQEGEIFLQKERRRQQKYYKPVAQLSNSERKKRNERIKARVQKHRKSKRIPIGSDPDTDNQLNDSTSGYGTQEAGESQLIVKFPNRRNGPRKRLTKALKTANTKLRKIIRENVEAKKKVKTLQRKLQRLSKPKSKHENLTPRKKTDMFMLKSGLVGEQVRKRLLLGNVLLHQMKTSAKKVNKKYRNSLYTAVAGEVIRKYRCISEVASELDFNRHKLSKIIKKGVNFTKVRRNRTVQKLKESVIQFLEREDNCRIQPGKRDATKCEEGKIQTRVLTDYMANLHQKYLAENPEAKLSLSTFCRIRPRHIHVTSCLSRNVCLCTKHQNLALKLQMLRRSGIDVPQNPESFIQSEAVVEKSQLPETVVYSKWKRVMLENKKKKMKIVSESVDRDAFFDDWLKEVSTFKMHYNTMKTQYQQTRILKEALPENEIVIHMDFAENYSCKTADEIQSAYWNSSQVTLHPMVIYFCGENNSLEHKSYVAVSDVLSHSSSTVLAILQKLFDKEIDLPGCNEIQYVHYWTDSPTSQYRNRYIFNSIINHENTFGCHATWNYYESGHGKNVCDGLGGTVKRLADEAVRSGKCTIQDADDFMNWATTSSMKGVKFFFVTKEECEDAQVELQRVNLAPVKGTLQLHAVRLNNDGQLCTREMSCYCKECISGRICDTWTIPDTQKPNSTGTKNTVAQNMCYNTGDFVASMYEGDWYVGRIIEVDHEDSDGYDYKITFMQHKKALYQWPSHEDVVWRKKADILCKISCPVPSGKSKRMYKLSMKDTDEIEKCRNMSLNVTYVTTSMHCNVQHLTCRITYNILCKQERCKPSLQSDSSFHCKVIVVYSQYPYISMCSQNPPGYNIYKASH